MKHENELNVRLRGGVILVLLTVAVMGIWVLSIQKTSAASKSQVTTKIK